MAKIYSVPEEILNCQVLPPETTGFYAYMLLCADGSLYTGWTNDLKQRVAVHNQGRGSKYTRTRRPVRLVYYEELETRQEAMSREWHLKRLSRAEKEMLIRNSIP